MIIEKFKQRSGITSLTTAQRQYADLMRQLAEIKPTVKVYRPQNRIRGFCYDLVAKKHGLLNRFIVVLIVLNISKPKLPYRNGYSLGMWQSSWQASSKTSQTGCQIFKVTETFVGSLFLSNIGALDYIYFSFIVIFVLEIVIKLAGLGWKKWAQSKWNWFDALIASSTLAMLVMRLSLPMVCT